MISKYFFVVGLRGPEKLRQGGESTVSNGHRGHSPINPARQQDLIRLEHLSAGFPDLCAGIPGGYPDDDFDFSGTRVLLKVRGVEAVHAGQCGL